jgi:uncharacterized membrane-anchored protein
MPSDAINPTTITAHPAASRALSATPGYWLSMFTASALGTNLGDFAVDIIDDGRGLSFVVLAAIAALGIYLDSRPAKSSEFGFWLAIVTLRAAATNVGDFLTHDLAIGYATLTVLTGILTMIAGRYTRIDARKHAPRIDARYWAAMLIAGMFGTIGGDLLSHTVGLYVAAVLLCSLTLLLIIARSWIVTQSATAGAAAMSYWCVVLAERGAGTPFGDGLASHRAMGLGLPHAMLVTGSLFALALLIRARRTAKRPQQ